MDSVLQDRARFRQFVDSTVPLSKPEENKAISKIVTQLLKEADKKRLFEILRNLNSKHEYATTAHALLAELLPRFQPADYLETLKDGKDQEELKEILKIMGFYSQKHCERAERGLKRAHYPDYVLSQMTLDEELRKPDTLYVEAKAKPKSAKQISQQLKKRTQRVSDNLFGSDAGEDATKRPKKLA